MSEKLIIFFDGHCGLCNKAVDFIILRDKKDKFRFSPLQGQYIQQLEIKIDTSKLDTLYVYDGHNILSKTKAARIIGINLGGVWKLIALISKIIPLFICDWFYDQIAKNRFKLFGRRETCRLPSPSESKKFFP